MSHRNARSLSGNEWATNFTNEGRVRVSSTYPYAGVYSLLLDDAEHDAIYSYAAAILAVDLSGQSQVELEFWWDEWGTTIAAGIMRMMGCFSAAMMAPPGSK